MPTRRRLLAASALAAAVGIAGCIGETGDEDGDEPEEESTTDGAAIGVAAEWNAIRARVADAEALGVAEAFPTGASVAQHALQRFEGATAEWGAHEQLEETDHDIYAEFEEALEELQRDGLEEGDLERARTEVEIADEQLRSAQRERLAYENLLALEMGLFAARLADVEWLALAGRFGAAETVAAETDERWEDADAHDALGSTDPDLYAAFEGELPGLESAVGDGDLDAVVEAVDAAMTAAFEAAYVLAADEAAADAACLSAMQARGWDAAVLAGLEDVAPQTAAGVAREAFARFESARVHEALETADHDTYEAFEGELEAYIDALEADKGVDDVAADFADAAERAGFAVAGALEEVPGAGDDGDHDHGHDDHEDLEGGPNVVEGVPEDADHVVEVRAASFEPAELTVEAGETVAFEHVGGEPHTVTADGDGIPDDATYWASGGFESESAATEGWREGRGAVVDGQAYVRTFDAAGSHEYYCIPHEAAGQRGRIDVK